MTKLIPEPRNITHSLAQSDLDEILESAEIALRSLVNLRVLITGASGFVGSWLTEAWCNACSELNGDGELILLNRNVSARQVAVTEGRRMIKLVHQDLRDFQIEDMNIDLIVHAATTASQNLNANDPTEMGSVIKSGTRIVAELALHHGCRLLNLSSGAVYGLLRSGERCYSENRAISTDSLIEGSQYHRSKIEAEDFLLRNRETKGLDFVNARLFAFIAPLLPVNSHFAAGNFLRDALANDEICIRGDGSSVRSYMYGSDLVSWLFNIAVEGTSGESYNVGSPHAVTVKQLAESFGNISHKKLNFENKPTDGNPYYLPCTEKVESEMNLKVTVGLEESILRTKRWWEQALGVG